MKIRNHVRSSWEKEGIRSLALVISILCLCLKLKSRNPFSNQTTLYDIVINSNCVNLPEKLCLIWASTRDLKQRKFYFPTSYRLWSKLSSKSKIIPCFLTYSLGWRCSNKSWPQFFSKQCNQVHGTQREKS